MSRHFGCPSSVCVCFTGRCAHVKTLWLSVCVCVFWKASAHVHFGCPSSVCVCVCFTGRLTRRSLLRKASAHVKTWLSLLCVCVCVLLEGLSSCQDFGCPTVCVCVTSVMSRTLAVPPVCVCVFYWKASDVKTLWLSLLWCVCVLWKASAHVKTLWLSLLCVCVCFTGRPQLMSRG